jgi:hypothetical protein
MAYTTWHICLSPRSRACFWEMTDVGLRGPGARPLRLSRPRPVFWKPPRAEPVAPAPDTTAALRQRRRRERLRQGRFILKVEVDEAGLVEVLTAASLLSPSVDHGRPEIQAAAQRLLGLMIAEGKRSR